MKYFDEYTITRCKVDCETQYIDRHCKCREIQMPSNEGLYHVSSDIIDYGYDVRPYMFVHVHGSLRVRQRV